MIYRVYAILLLTAIPFVAVTQDTAKKPETLSLQGYIKELPAWLYPGNGMSTSFISLLHNRINLKARLGQGWSARMEVRSRLLTGNRLSDMPGVGKSIDSYNGLVRLSELWVDQPDLVVHSVIDRLMIQYESDKWDIRAGRQRINWGLSNTWNPNDIFNAYNFLDFDYEERPGTDAIRVTRHLKNQRSLELAWKPGKNRQDHIAAMITKWNARGYDFQFMAGRCLSDWVAGGGWAGSIREAGFKGEFSCFVPARNSPDSQPVLTATAMVDQSFEKEWYVSLSVLYISHVPEGSMVSGNLINTQLTAKTLFPYRFSIAGTISKQISPLKNFQCALLYSPDRNDFILFPGFSWNLATNIDLDIISQGFLTTRNRSKLLQSGALYLRGKWSF